MWPDMDVAFSKLMNPRMSMGITLLQTLLAQLHGPPVAPRDVRDMIEELFKGTRVSKQSITNAARRLYELNLLERPEEGGYAVRYGYLIALLVGAVMDLMRKVESLEEELDSIRRPRPR